MTEHRETPCAAWKEQPAENGLMDDRLWEWLDVTFPQRPGTERHCRTFKKKLAGSTLSAVRLCSRGRLGPIDRPWQHVCKQVQGGVLVPPQFSHHLADRGICATAVATVAVATLMPPSAPVMCRRLSVSEEQRKCRSMSGGASDRRCETRARRTRWRLPVAAVCFAMSGPCYYPAKQYEGPGG